MPPRFFRANDLATLDVLPEGQISRVQPDGTSVTAMASRTVDGAVLYCAAYGENGRMTAVASAPVEGDGLFHAYTLTLDTSAYSEVKAFLLSGDSRPLCKSV